MASENGSDDEKTVKFLYEGEEEEWSHDHVRLLYLMSKYAIRALRPEDKEGWIRQVLSLWSCKWSAKLLCKLPLLVLVYEAIRKGCLDYDYAPASVLVSYGGRSRRVWMNITQEGKSAIEDLLEKNMISGLKVGHL
jgi:WD repeat-containing protein 35